MNGYQQKRIKALVAWCQESPEKFYGWETVFIQHLASMPDDQDLTKNENHKLNEVAQKVRA